MNLSPIKIFFKRTGQWIAKHSPTILTAVGSGGVVASVVTAVRATPRAAKKIEAKKAELGVEKLPIKETIKTCWKDYMPTAGLMVGTIGCFLGANYVNARHQAAIAGLYSLAEQGLIAKDKELAALKNEMVKNLGEEKAQEIQQKIEQDHQPVVKLNDAGRYLFKFAGQMFYAKPSKIWKAENKINRRLHGGFEMYLSLNDILYELELEPDTIYGDELFISIDDGCEFRFGNTDFTDDGELYVQLNLETPPHAK